MRLDEQLRSAILELLSVSSLNTVGAVLKDVQLDPAGAAVVTIELPKMDPEGARPLQSAIESRVRSIAGVSDVTVFLAPRPRPQPAATAQQRLPGVRRILAVSSCKGGVGKSTVAVNLAYTLASMGRSVGIFDADVYGPSLPTMVRPTNKDVRMLNNRIQPLLHGGVRLMSFGYVNAGPEGGPAIMRGPMVSQVIQQLLTTTHWGELDYLIIDFPPGTGDIQLTLLQLVSLTAAVIVTTPQQLSFVDVVKGIQMFDKLKVPTIAVVENMSYFACPRCGERQHLFGQGARRQLVEQFGIRNSFEVPLIPELSRLGDSGEPAVRAATDSRVRELYDAIARSVESELDQLERNGAGRPTVAFDRARGLVITRPDGSEHILHAAAVRRACRCAHCIEEFSGRALLKPESVDEWVTPTAITPMGNYAVAIHWSDGHDSSVYPFDTLLSLASV